MSINEEWKKAQDNTVKFDTIDEEKRFVRITKDNAIKAMSLILADQNYVKSYDERTQNSSAKLFEEYKIEKSKDNNKLLPLDILMKINAENNTRVKVEYIKDYIYNNLKNIDLFDILKQKNPDYSIIEGIYTINEPNKKEEQRSLISYASKLCHFYCWHILGYDAAENFPIFDSILRRVILLYYNGKNFDKFAKTMNTDNKSIENVKEFYDEYVNALKKISEENSVSVTGVEQFLWWFYKDRKLPTMKEIKEFRKNYY